MHRFQPVVDGLKGDVRIRALDGGDNGAQPRISTNAALGARRGKPRLGAFADQGALKLGSGAQNLKRELALRGCSVDRVMNGTEERALGHALQHACKDRPRTISARGLFFMYLSTARGFQGLRLGQLGLILS
ncbi:hypothetical protein SAMN04488238_11048 [Roseicitreum antarcticum]|uniref:Uncharacterized protein n=1 Tax=Roseicitreum antarcticum TaxID=564137 RepID=A0A1H3CVC3_9RHOB|nr:hypothetical protein SAMN04488238_11048 [Roseicitreum antarcticum]